MKTDDDGWIHRSQSYIQTFGPWLAVWIVLAIWIVWRRRSPEALGFFLVSIPILAYLYLLTIGLFFGGPPSGPRAEPWLRWSSLVSMGWFFSLAFSILASFGYGIAAIVMFIRKRRLRLEQGKIDRVS